MGEGSSEGKAVSGSPPWPSWLKDLVYFVCIIVALVVFGQGLKSDQRSTTEALDRLSRDLSGVQFDVAAMRNSLPNPDVLNLRFKAVEERVAELKGQFDFEAAKAQKLREQLARKGMVD